MEASAMAVNAATGTLGPVLAKLTTLLGDEYKLVEGSRSDAMSIRFQLEAVLSLLLRIWGVGDVDADAACKDDLMVELRELSYDMEDATDDLSLSLKPSGDGGLIQRSTDRSPFEELMTRVNDVSKRFSDNKWKLPVKQPSTTPRARVLPQHVPAELVGMDQHKDELIKLLIQGADTRISDNASRWRNGTPHSDIRTRAPIKQKIVIKMNMESPMQRSHVLTSVATIAEGVDSLRYFGDLKDKLEVVGEGFDIINLMTNLRKVIHAELLEVGYAKEKVEKTTICEQPTTAYGHQQFHEVKTVCIAGLAGGGKTTLARLLYHALQEQFQCRAFVSAYPGLAGPKMTEILTDILTGVTNAPYAGNGAATEQDLTDRITNFLMDKRYLVVIDDIWHWKAWEIIRKSLPKNNLGSRTIMTTRLNSIAKKCLKHDKNDAFLYEIGALDPVDAWLLSDKIIRKPLGVNTALEIFKDIPDFDIVDMCYRMPLALICMSSALAEKIQDRGSGELLERRRAVRLVEDGILDIPSLKPLAESLCLGYDELPPYLWTFLLSCSVYHWGDSIERGRLIRRWIAEGFVSEEKAAEGYFDELVDREWIKQVQGSKYEIHPVMLAFLRCKSREYNFVTCLGVGSEIPSPSPSSSTPKIRRLSLQRGYPVDCFSSMDMSHTRSLVVLGDVTRVRFSMFKRLQVLDIEDNNDIPNSHLQHICEQLSHLRLRYLGLKGTRISKLPQVIRKLKHLQTLDLRDTQISELPIEIGKLKRLQTLDVRNTQIRELPPQIGELKHLRTLDVGNTRVRELPWQCGQISEVLRVLAGDSNRGVQLQLPEGVNQALDKGIPEDSRAKCREVLSIEILDRFEPPLVGIFKVPGRHMRIPLLIKQHFVVLSCLDIRLCKLEADDHKFLADMPNLRTLVLRLEALPRELLRIDNKGFPVLESFRLDSRLPRITFEEGAMPKLKHLEFKFYAGPRPPTDDPVGITNLPSLQKVIFRCSPWYKSEAPGISAIIAVVRKEIQEHGNNRINLILINGGKEEDILSEARTSSQNVDGSCETSRVQSSRLNLQIIGSA